MCPIAVENLGYTEEKKYIGEESWILTLKQERRQESDFNI